MDLDFVAVHYLILKALAYALDKTKEQITLTAPVTIEYEGNAVLFVYGKVVIEKYIFTSQEELHKYFKDGRRYGKAMKNMILSLESDHEREVSPLHKKMDTMREFIRNVNASRSSQNERKGSTEGGSSGKQQESSSGPEVPPANPFIAVRIELSNLLGISPLTPPKEIKRAYRKFMQMNHPDKNPNSDHDLVARINGLMDRFDFLGKFFNSRGR